jgi:predicted nucleic acid-binding protein
VIVVDTNLIAYLLCGGEHTDIAREVFLRDHEWSAPILWRSEFANVLARPLRRKEISVERAVEIHQLAEALLDGRQFAVPTERVLQLVAASPCSAYDCEFVALAQYLKASLVTSDRDVLRAFPQIALSPDRFLEAAT